MKKIVILFSGILLLTGCTVTIHDEIKDRDEAIKECKNKGGIPYVENYNDSMNRPIVNCLFKGDSNE